MSAASPHTLLFAGLLLALPAAAIEPSGAQSAAPAQAAAPVAPVASATPAAARQQDVNTAYQRPVFAAEPGISDPTRISETFRDALERRMPSKAAPSAPGAAAAAPKMPEIALAASACGHDKGMMHAMLRINGKVELVRPGDRITLVEQDGVIEIRVLDMQRDHVHLRVLAGKTDEELILH